VKLSLLVMELSMCYKVKCKYPWTRQEGTQWLEVGLHEVTTWMIDVEECSVLRPGRFTTGERVPGASEPI
jgi:hypothetical protein